MAALDLEKIKPKLLELYVERKLDCVQVRDELEKQGTKLSYRTVTKYIKVLGVMRSISEQHVLSGNVKRLRWEKTCEFCCEPFTSVTKHGRWCDTCVPKHSQLGDEARLWGGYAKKFGLTKVQYEALLQAQGNSCAVCKKSFESMPRHQIHLDHCHDSGRVRGILCLYCNRGIGCFFNDPSALKGAIDYLNTWRR